MNQYPQAFPCCLAYSIIHRKRLIFSENIISWPCAFAGVTEAFFEVGCHPSKAALNNSN